MRMEYSKSSFKVADDQHLSDETNYLKQMGATRLNRNLISKFFKYFLCSQRKAVLHIIDILTNY